MQTFTSHFLLQQGREDNSEKVLADDLTVKGNTSVQKESPSTHQNEGFVLEMPDVSFENRDKVSKVDILMFEVIILNQLSEIDLK